MIALVDFKYVMQSKETVKWLVSQELSVEGSLMDGVSSFLSASQFALPVVRRLGTHVPQVFFVLRIVIRLNWLLRKATIGLRA